MRSILFVCTGNICRSPTAEAVFRHLAREARLSGLLTVDSAGTHDYHTGDPPDERSIAAARRRGVAMDGLRARPVEDADFERFDLILAMDAGHMRHLRRMAGPESRANLALFLDYAGPERAGGDVPDPYYGAEEDFEMALDLIFEGARGLLARLCPEK